MTAIIICKGLIDELRCIYLQVEGSTLLEHPMYPFTCTIHWPNMMNSGASTCQLGVVPYWNIALTSLYYHLLPFATVVTIALSKLCCHVFAMNNLFYLYIHV